MTTTAAVSALGAVSQSFKTTGAGTIGGLASLENNKQGYVEEATSDKASQLVGIIADRPLVALDNGANQVRVVTSGVTPALVSDINGDVKTGDKITASPVQGVGMKAMTSTEIVGTAQSNLRDSDTTAHTVTDKNGNQKQVKIGTVDIQVNITYYAIKEDKLSAIVPSFLVNVGSAVAGKDLSPIRVLIGFFCLLIGFTLAGIMLWSAVRSGIISIGRNPLAHSVLRRSLIDVLVTSLGVMLITGIVFYVVLTS